ncbi:protein indeterminate-domain 2 [Senna tora]|uniref:Protein indeterminate-domain 2 n=1 Tax=Senna tora TaxID=362788 RepID=A0A834WC53_9FABA|nr:protein indeterminate-domain 2 [Senna tora]
MSNNTSGESGSLCTEKGGGEDGGKQASEIFGQFHSPNSLTSTTTNSNGSNTPPPPPPKRKRNLPGNPDPSAEVIALSPNTLMATNRFICEICNKGFQRDQNLQLHRRGHNLPWKLKQRSSTEIRKKVYVCPEASCVHHNPARALGDLTGIKKHFCRKHGEKKWKCDKCSKKYAVQSDWKAHSKICGTREYKCDCGTIFSRRDSFITHRAFCDALAEENNKGIMNIEQQMPRMMSPNLQGQQLQNLVASLPINANIPNPQIGSLMDNTKHHPLSMFQELMPMPAAAAAANKAFNNNNNNMNMNNGAGGGLFTRSASSAPSLQLSSNSVNVFEDNNVGHHPLMSATALLQKAAQMGATVSSNGGAMMNSRAAEKGFVVTSMAPASFGTSDQHSFMNNHNHYMQMMNGEGEQQEHIYGMNGVDMFNAILDQSKAFSKMMEENNNGVLSSTGGGAINKGSGDVMTLDFLGIGGGGGHANFYGTQHQAVAEKGTRDEVWRNWSTKNNNAAGFESLIN